MSRLCCLEAHCADIDILSDEILQNPRSPVLHCQHRRVNVEEPVLTIYKKKTHTPCAKFSLPTLETYKQAGLNGCAVGWRSGPDAGQAAAAAAAAID